MMRKAKEQNFHQGKGFSFVCDMTGHWTSNLYIYYSMDKRSGIWTLFVAAITATTDWLSYWQRMCVVFIVYWFVSRTHLFPPSVYIDIENREWYVYMSCGLWLFRISLQTQPSQYILDASPVDSLSFVPPQVPLVGFAVASTRAVRRQTWLESILLFNTSASLRYACHASRYIHAWCLSTNTLGYCRTCISHRFVAVPTYRPCSHAMG